MKRILLLNSTYEAFSIIELEKAVNLILRDKVEILHYDDVKKLRSINFEIVYPEVLRLKKYIRWNKRNIAPTKKAIFERDEYVCQYCGKHLSNSDATVDHIIPKKYFKGINCNSFENLCTSCQRCNKRKGDKTLDQFLKETGYTFKKPSNPSYLQMFRNYNVKSWEPYLFIN